MTLSPDGRCIDILLVEDNPGDVRLTVEILKECRVCNRISVVTDGDEALDFLNRKGRHVSAAQPDLILLDLNLPKKTGKEVLAEIKRSEVFRRIPVVVLTTSTDKNDVLSAYDLYANCYISKPLVLENFVQIVRSIENFWLTVVKLPTEVDGYGN